MQQEKKYNPAACDHKLPNGLGSWMFHSKSSGSGPDMYHDVHVSVCIMCGTIRIGGFRSDNEGKLNRFNEEFNIHAADAIDAMIKYANYIHEEKVWGRLTERPAGAEWVKASEFKYEVQVAYHAKDNDSKGAGFFNKTGCFLWGDGSITHPRDQDDLLILDESPNDILVPASATVTLKMVNMNEVEKLKAKGEKMALWLRRLRGSMMAHPDYHPGENSEFNDMVSGCNEALAGWKGCNETLPRVAQQGAVWVMATDRLPGWYKPTKWRLDGVEMDGQYALAYMTNNYPNSLYGWQWLDESGQSKESIAAHPIELYQQHKESKEGNREREVAFAEYCKMLPYSRAMYTTTELWNEWNNRNRKEGEKEVKP